MKKKICALLLAGLLLLTATGCRSLFEDDYYYETDITGDFGALSGNAKEIRNLSMLKTALTDMISRHEAQGEFRLVNYNGKPSEDLAAACFEIKSNSPLGAYAVENISYDTSYVVSYYMANIYISYKRTAEELQSIRFISSAADLDELILSSTAEYSRGVVARLYSAVMNEEHIRSVVKRAYYDDPVTQVLEPQVTVTTYPREGANRIYDVRFDYGASQAANMAMSLNLSGRLRTAVAAMTEEEPLYLALESAEYLDQLCSGEAVENGHPSTAYGAFVENHADSKGMALAYRALCQRLDIPCTVVEGNVRTMGMETHFWNIITIDGDCYHVDVSALADDPEAAFLRSDDGLWGTYIWEPLEYPACSGTLTYADAARLEPEQTEDGAQPGTADAPETEPEDEQPGAEEAPPEESEKTA